MIAAPGNGSTSGNSNNGSVDDLFGSVPPGKDRMTGREQGPASLA